MRFRLFITGIRFCQFTAELFQVIVGSGGGSMILGDIFGHADQLAYIRILQVLAIEIYIRFPVGIKDHTAEFIENDGRCNAIAV